ncbi:MAG TPA: hypothetical protein VHD33_00810 [Legionellaceae bacterium]|nr:hypothetical protein [Legionellaceae bacterium]
MNLLEAGMIAEELKKIFEAEEQERAFYLHRLKPALDRLEHAENVLAERLKIEQLVANTPFMEAFNRLEASDNHNLDESQRLYKLNHLCQDIIRTNHVERQKNIAQLMQQVPKSQLTPEALYYVAHMYSQGDTEKDAEQADKYLQQALQLKPTPQYALKLKELLALNYDRWQLRKTPPQPQKYGTVYADHHDVAKGLEKNQLIRPHHGYHYQRDMLERARKELGIGSLAEQEKKWIIPVPKMRGKSLLGDQKPRPTLKTCSKCGGTGHLAIACIQPKKPYIP